MYLHSQADQRLKQNHEDLLLLAHLQELYLSVTDFGLILSQELVITNVRCVAVFVMLSESVAYHAARSFDVKPADLGFKSTDQTWHYEQWLHLKFASRKCRQNPSLADSNS